VPGTLAPDADVAKPVDAADLKTHFSAPRHRFFRAIFFFFHSHYDNVGLI
jgi:hypothetical protein